MLRYLQVKQNKVVPLLVAADDLTTGAVVAKSASTEKVDVTSGLGDFLVDRQKTYTGLNAASNPSDVASTSIVSGEKCELVPTFVGERYATSEATGSLRKGNPIVASNGKFVKATGGAAYQWVYGGIHYEGTTKYKEVERVATGTAPATKTISYNANSGTGLMVDGDSPYFVGDVAIVLKSTFTPPTGKVFTKWNTADDDSGTSYDPGDEITVDSSNITLYAIYVDK